MEADEDLFISCGSLLMSDTRSLKCSEVCHQCVLVFKQEDVDVFCKSDEDCSSVW